MIVDMSKGNCLSIITYNFCSKFIQTYKCSMCIGRSNHIMFSDINNHNSMSRYSSNYSISYDTKNHNGIFIDASHHNGGISTDTNCAFPLTQATTTCLLTSNDRSSMFTDITIHIMFFFSNNRNMFIGTTCLLSIDTNDHKNLMSISINKSNLILFDMKCTLIVCYS